MNNIIYQNNESCAIVKLGEFEIIDNYYFKVIVNKHKIYNFKEIVNIPFEFMINIKQSILDSQTFGNNKILINKIIW